MSRAHRARALLGATAAASLLLLLAPEALGQRSVWTFEAGPVRPLALSPDGTRLFATNLPDGRLEIFDVSHGALRHLGSVAVGLEPVAVAARSDAEVWVVNHLSDSISVVDVGSDPPRVRRTLLVGDEPNDIVFAGENGRRAFVTSAHRGQNTPYPDGDAASGDVPRADVWVFDAADPGGGLGGTPLAIVSLFGDKPRGLAVSPDGHTVYAGIFHSGNRTTAIPTGVVCDGGELAAPCEVLGQTSPGGLPAPNDNWAGEAGPPAGLIVQQDAGGAWRDELERDWSAQVRFQLPDDDVFAIDASAETPVVTGTWKGVGTTLFNLVVNPVTGELYVSNTEARNRVRFEGHGDYAAPIKTAGEPASVRGHLAESRITVLSGATVAPRHLNKHIPYGTAPTPAGVEEASLATPVEMAVTADGQTLYVAAFGSSKIGVFEVAALEADTFTPDAASHIEVGGGPSGVVLDEARRRLYTLTRFDNSVVAVDLDTNAAFQALPLHDREPDFVREGRPFLYDARETSSNGEASCASCHVFGDVDDLAWDLGDPDGDVADNPNAFLPGGSAEDLPFHPMKGPMTTQTLRGLANHGPQHWRGDRVGTEEQAFTAFNPAFPGLVGRDEGELAEEDMQRFTDFALALVPPPNPTRRLDNTTRADERRGRTVFFNKPSFPTFGAGLVECNLCHTLDPPTGRIGTSTLSGETNSQPMKVPPLRNAYQKAGFFGSFSPIVIEEGALGSVGPQVRGFGLGHDGTSGSVSEFLGSPLFVLTQQERDDLVAFVLAFPSNLAPIVGQQVTLGASLAAEDRADLLVERSGEDFVLLEDPTAKECDLVVHAVVEGEARSWQRRADGLFEADRALEAPWTEAALRVLAETPGSEPTYTCVPPGAGARRGLDRDLDGHRDGDERQVGSDPANPASFQGVCGDGLDNDGDGLSDADDPGCGSEQGLAENPACQDGLDNDGDGLADFPEDPDCTGPSDGVELAPEPASHLLQLSGVLAAVLARWRARTARRGP